MQTETETEKKDETVREYLDRMELSDITGKKQIKFTDHKTQNDFIRARDIHAYIVFNCVRCGKQTEKPLGFFVENGNKHHSPKIKTFHHIEEVSMTCYTCLNELSDKMEQERKGEI